MGVLWLNSGREVHQLVSFRGLYFSYLIFSFFLLFQNSKLPLNTKKESDLYSIIPELRSKYMESKLPSSLQELVPHTLNKTSLEILHQNGEGWIVASGYTRLISIHCIFYFSLRTNITPFWKLVSSSKNDHSIRACGCLDRKYLNFASKHDAQGSWHLLVVESPFLF